MRARDHEYVKKDNFFLFIKIFSWMNAADKKVCLYFVGPVPIWIIIVFEIYLVIKPASVTLACDKGGFIAVGERS